MSDFNMVNNGRFARNSTNGVNDWNHVNLVASDTTVMDSERGSCLRITGEPDKEKRVLQGIYAKGGEGDVFRFGCFAKADALRVVVRVLPELRLRLDGFGNLGTKHPVVVPLLRADNADPDIAAAEL